MSTVGDKSLIIDYSIYLGQRVDKCWLSLWLLWSHWTEIDSLSCRSKE